MNCSDAKIASQKIASYIIQHHKEVINMTIGELAKASGASVATISRFCRKCEVDGFHHLKISLAKEIVETGTEFSVSNDITRDDIGQSLQNILANKIEELKQTISLMDTKQLNKILDCLQNARIVHLIAVGNTIPVALDGAFKLNEIGIKAGAEDGHGCERKWGRHHRNHKQSQFRDWKHGRLSYPDGYPGKAVFK